MKPQYIIKKFSGMWENWLFWCEWFSPEVSWWDINLVNNIGMGDVKLKTATWFTNYENSNAIQDFFIDKRKLFVTIWERYLHVFWDYWAAPFQLHDIGSTSWNSWRYSDLATTKEGDLLYTTPISLWRWYRASATSASATTLVDNTKDFWYSIYSNYDGYLLPSLDQYNNKVTNLTKGKEYTVTSIWFTDLQYADLAGAYASTYAVPAAISETAANTKTWTPTKSISSQVWVWLVSKGTWVVTITVHDSLNTVLSTYSIPTTSLTDSQMNYFYCPAFKAYWPNLHFHITSTGTTTIKSNTANDLSTASFTIRIGDTLNFASATPTPQSGDDFMLFADRKYNFDDSANDVVYPHFANQLDRYYFKRQIKQYGDEFFLTNGNWMSSLSSETFSAWAKRMPDNHQLIAFGINGANVLFSCIIQGKGKLMLWDGYSNNFNSMLDIDMPTTSLATMDDGWVFVSNWQVYFTNWYSIKPLTSVIDSNSIGRTFFNILSFNWLEIFNGKLIMSVYWDKTNRANSWIYVYDFNWNWSFQPINSSWINEYDKFPKVVYATIDDDSEWTAAILDPIIFTWSDLWIHYISWNWDKWNFIMKLKLWEKRRLSMVRLNLTKTDGQSLSSNDYSWVYDITCSYGKWKGWVITDVQTTSSTKSTITVDWRSNKCETWTELLVIKWYTGDPLGERTFIQSKTGEWTATEVWTISPELSAVWALDLYLKNINVKKSWTKTVQIHDLNETCNFDLNDFYGDTLVLEFVFKWTNCNNIWVSSIELY